MKLLTPLCELFSKSVVNRNGQLSEIVGATSIPRSAQLGDDLGLQIWLQGFKKARFDTFDLQIFLKIHFDPFKYRIVLSPTQPPLEIQHFYQEQLTKDEITEIAQKLTRLLLEAIKKKTNGHT